MKFHRTKVRKESIRRLIAERGAFVHIHCGNSWCHHLETESTALLYRLCPQAQWRIKAFPWLSDLLKGTSVYLSLKSCGQSILGEKGFRLARRPSFFNPMSFPGVTKRAYSFFFFPEEVSLKYN